MAVTEKAVVNNLDDVLDEIKRTKDPEELATLVILSTELYSQGNSVCEVRSSSSRPACLRNMVAERDKMHKTLVQVFSKLKGA